MAYLTQGNAQGGENPGMTLHLTLIGARLFRYTAQVGKDS